MNPEELAQVRDAVARARAERAQDRTPRDRGVDADSGALGEDEERERSEWPR